MQGISKLLLWLSTLTFFFSAFITCVICCICQCWKLCTIYTFEIKKNPLFVNKYGIKSKCNIAVVYTNKHLQQTLSDNSKLLQHTILQIKWSIDDSTLSIYCCKTAWHIQLIGKPLTKQLQFTDSRVWFFTTRITHFYTPL